MESVVIIGGNSLALELIKNYRKKKFKIYYLVRKKKKNISNQFLINLRKKNIINFLNLKKPKVIINLVSSYSNNPSISFKANVNLPIWLLDWTTSNRKCRLVLIGSAAEYGKIKKKQVNESTKLNPISVYGISKSIQSIVAKYYYDNYKTNFLLLRLFNLKGKIFNKNLLVGKINNFFKNHKSKKTVLQLGNLSNYRDYIDEKLVAKYIVKLVKKSPDGEIINVGSGKPILVRNLVKDYFAKYKNFKYKENINKNKTSDPKYIFANIKKLNKIIKT